MSDSKQQEEIKTKAEFKLFIFHFWHLCLSKNFLKVLPGDAACMTPSALRQVVILDQLLGFALPGAVTQLHNIPPEILAKV